jgi:ubiquinone/menaquinone biosynthesis C-methylase UbiE
MSTHASDRFSKAAGWLDRWRQGAVPQAVANAALLRLPVNLKLDEHTRHLDLGCGRGALLRALDDQLRAEAPPVGLDASRDLLRQAHRDERNPLRGAGLVEGDPLALPFRDGAFNLVTCGYQLRYRDHDEVRALFMEIRRVLEPGGLAVIWEYGPSGNRRLDAWNARVLAPRGPRPSLRSARTLLGLAAEAGFEFTRHADLRPFLAPPIPRASILVGRPPEGFDITQAARRA